MITRAAVRLAVPLVRRIPSRLGQSAVKLWLAAISTKQPERALRELLDLEAYLTWQVDQAAIRYGGGVHPKHRLTRYHDFFVERIRAGERVLDVGCGKGELAHDLAARAEAVVTGIDLNHEYLRFAREHFAHPRLAFVQADALGYQPDESFDAVVLSNVLEHIEERPALLRRIVETAGPERLLIRVPLLTRHWTVPLRVELGLPHFGEATHFVEYEPGSFADELRSAGLQVPELIVNWGEIWAVARPVR